MGRNFVCLWRKHNCRSQVIDLWLSALISWIMKSIIGCLINCNLHTIISTLLVIKLHWVKKIYFAVLVKFITISVSSFNLLQLFNYTPYLFKKNGSNQRSILSVYVPMSRRNHMPPCLPETACLLVSQRPPYSFPFFQNSLLFKKTWNPVNKFLFFLFQLGNI